MPPQQAPNAGQPQSPYQPQPVPPQPQAPQQSYGPEQSPPVTQPFAGQPPVPTQAPKRRSKKLLIAAILAGVAAVAFGLYMLFGRGPSLPKTDTTVINAISSTPTAADIAGLDKTEAFWAYFKNAAEQQKLIVTKVETGLVEGRFNYSKAGIDYATKKYVIAQEEQENGEMNAPIRCYDGKSYIPRGSNLDRPWLETGSSDPIYQCDFKKRQDKFNDGVNTGGLTPKQSQAFVGTLRAQPGLMTVQNVELVQHKNKPYLHFTVDLKPAPGPSGFIKFGGGWLMMAFRKTGIEPTEHPYAYFGSEGYGFKYEYYVDPATKLPAYSEVILDNVEGGSSTHVYKNHYQFGEATFDAKTTNHEPLTFDW